MLLKLAHTTKDGGQKTYQCYTKILYIFEIRYKNIDKMSIERMHLYTLPQF